jgi:hypothetical protein
MEQILSRLLTEMNAMREKMGSNKGGMKAEVETNQEKTDDHQEEVASLASRIEANQRDKSDAWIEGTEASVGKLEAKGKKSDAVTEHQEVRHEQATVETVGALED